MDLGQCVLFICLTLKKKARATVDFVCFFPFTQPLCKPSCDGHYPDELFGAPKASQFPGEATLRSHKVAQTVIVRFEFVVGGDALPFAVCFVILYLSHVLYACSAVGVLLKHRTCAR